MNNFSATSLTFGVVLSLLSYGVGLILKKRFKNSLFNPLLISVILVIATLLLFHIDFQAYYASAKYLGYLLTPATVSLALPLYCQLEKLRSNILAILCSLTAGVITSLASVWGLSLLFRLSAKESITLLPKSITTAIGMGISEEMGGIVSITVAVIMLTGILGNVAGDLVCRLFRITHPIAKGLGMGAASHAVGTARAMQWGELEGAMSSLALVVSGLLTVIGMSVLQLFL